MRWPVLCLVAVLVAARTAGAAGWRDLSGTWLVDWPEVQAVLEGAPPRPGAGWWVGAGSGRLFGMPELPQRRLETGLTSAQGRFGAGLGWEVLGGQVYRETLAEAWVAVGRPVGVTLRGCRTERRLAGVTAGPGLALGLDLAVGPVGGAGWSVRLDIRALTQVLRTGAADVPRRGLARLVVTHPGLGLGVVLERQADGRPLVGFELVWRLAVRAGLSLRADPATGSWGPGFVCRVGRFRLRTSHVVHPVLGPSHRVMLAVGAPGGRSW